MYVRPILRYTILNPSIYVFNSAMLSRINIHSIKYLYVYLIVIILLFTLTSNRSLRQPFIVYPRKHVIITLTNI